MNTFHVALFVTLCAIVSSTNYDKTTNHGTQRQLAGNSVHVAPSIQRQIKPFIQHQQVLSPIRQQIKPIVQHHQVLSPIRQQIKPIVQHQQVLSSIQQQTKPIIQHQDVLPSIHVDMIPSIQTQVPVIKQQVVSSVKKMPTLLIQKQVVPSTSYIANQPQLYNYVPVHNVQYSDYLPNAAQLTQVIGGNMQYRKNSFHGYGKRPSSLLTSTPVFQSGFFSHPSVFDMPYTTRMFPVGYGSAAFSPYPQESFLDKAGKFIGKNLPLLLTGGALYALARG